MEHAHKAGEGGTEYNKKTTKMASARKPESFVWTDNEVELHEHKHVVHHYYCCCYVTGFRGRFEGKRSRGGAMASSLRKVCRLAVQTRM